MLGEAATGSPIAKRVYDVHLALEKLPAGIVAIYVAPAHAQARSETIIARQVGLPTHTISVAVVAKVAASPDEPDAITAELDKYSGLSERIGYIVKSLAGRTMPTSKAAAESMTFPWFVHPDYLRSNHIFLAEVRIVFRAGEATP
jgi:hypothetical protein